MPQSQCKLSDTMTSTIRSAGTAVDKSDILSLLPDYPLHDVKETSADHRSNTTPLKALPADGPHQHGAVKKQHSFPLKIHQRGFNFGAMYSGEKLKRGSEPDSALEGFNFNGMSNSAIAQIKDLDVTFSFRRKYILRFPYDAMSETVNSIKPTNPMMRQISRAVNVEHLSLDATFLPVLQRHGIENKEIFNLLWLSIEYIFPLFQGLTNVKSISVTTIRGCRHRRNLKEYFDRLTGVVGKKHTVTAETLTWVWKSEESFRFKFDEASYQWDQARVIADASERDRASDFNLYGYRPKLDEGFVCGTRLLRGVNKHWPARR